MAVRFLTLLYFCLSVSAAQRMFVEPKTSMDLANAEMQASVRLPKHYWVAEFGGVEGWLPAPHWVLNWNRELDSYQLSAAIVDFKSGELFVTKSRVLTSEMGQLIRKTWLTILLHSQHVPNERIGTDGEHYYFRFEGSEHSEMISGLSWVDKDEPAIRYVELAKTIALFAHDKVSCTELNSSIASISNLVGDDLLNDARCEP